jgi:hypothetical protein
MENKDSNRSAANKQSSSLYAVDLTRACRSADVAPFVNDSLRMLSIQAVVQLLYAFSDSRAMTSHEFFELILYVLLGVAFYWFVIAKLVSLT